MESCEIRPSECSQEFCNNGGKCIIDHTSDKGFICECLPNFTDPTCSTSTNPCASNPCSRDQICLNSEDSFICACIQGISCPNSFAASMAPLYKRPLFKRINVTYQLTNAIQCKVGTCKNDGICQRSANGHDFICKCKFGYIGNLVIL